MKIISSILIMAPDAVKTASSGDLDSPIWYIIGAVLGILLLVYLAYVLLKPEKF